MNQEEKQKQMAERNAAICAYYSTGHSLRECSSHFKLGRQRVQQVLESGQVWRPYVKSSRTRHIGVTVTDDTREGLIKVAEQRGVSVSRLTSDTLDKLVQEAK